MRHLSAWGLGGARRQQTGARIGAPARKVNNGRKLRRSELGRYTGFVPPNAAVIVADAHLGDPREQDADSFHRFLDSVPQLANHIVINGDLFDFWFEYRSVISRSAFPTLAALAKLRSAGVELTVTGGNHDRWGGGFWATELGGAFYRDSAEVELVGWKALVTHGDGVGEEHVAGRIMHAITRHPLTAAGFRLVHPDLGYGLAEPAPRTCSTRRLRLRKPMPRGSLRTEPISISSSWRTPIARPSSRSMPEDGTSIPGPGWRSGVLRWLPRRGRSCGDSVVSH